MKATYLPLLLLPVMAACDSVSGSRHMAREERRPGEFSQVEVSGSMDVYITQGSAHLLSIEAEDNIVPLVETDIDGGELRIRFRRNTNIRAHKPVKVYVTTPVLEGIDLNGSGDVEVKSHFSSPGRMHFGLSGSGDLSGSFNAPIVAVDLAGSGNVELKGQTRDLRINIAGSGNCEADELLAETVDVNIAGSGNAQVHASRELKTNTLGSGDVRYKGEPSIKSSKLGSGSVRKL
ncbi:head GIN domain-containing protein [Chitinophaga sp.]|uniref:head GIN domain-containing protein n=1 Tax=Chitinophaga sp. TaxID=1869181 RepID=UPI0031CDB0FB